ncbi:hypothetical protein B9479_003678 [Cryptococcus floricola]|uniref:Uncharacterized protein n=1 Tax=Cryptococcus floricola TaxID=2591691 RepID=A0A5D3B0G9_9TREE|nr:hypothetical protein B9479_003678 [Cryptococcus floricola]
MDVRFPEPGELFCFSAISESRCQGLTGIQYVMAYIPSALGILLIPTLLTVAYTRPRSTLILLSIEVLLTIALSTWDFAVHIDAPKAQNIAVNDTALAIISALPNLFFLLFCTSHIITDLRPLLPSVLRADTTTHGFVLLIAPLVPIAFVVELLSTFLLLNYAQQLRTTLVGFETSSDLGLHNILTWIAAGTSMGFIAFTILIGILILTNSKTRYSRKIKDITRWGERAILFGLLIAAVDIGLSLVPVVYPLIVARHAIRFVSRIFIAFGLLGIYRYEKKGWGEIGDSYTAFTDDKRRPASIASVSTFGTPPIYPLPTGQRPGMYVLPGEAGSPTKPQAGTYVLPGASFAARRKASQKRKGNKSRGAPSKLVIGGPIPGTFQRLAGGETRDFYMLNSAKFGGMAGAQAGGIGRGLAAAGTTGMMGAVSRLGMERVTLRTPAGRGPMLSIVSSTFSALEPMTRTRSEQPAIEPGPGTAISSTALTVKKFTGSIYAPSAISVEASELHRWPPEGLARLKGLEEEKERAFEGIDMEEKAIEGVGTGVLRASRMASEMDMVEKAWMAGDLARASPALDDRDIQLRQTARFLTSESLTPTGQVGSPAPIARELPTAVLIQEPLIPVKSYFTSKNPRASVMASVFSGHTRNGSGGSGTSLMADEAVRMPQPAMVTGREEVQQLAMRPRPPIPLAMRQPSIPQRQISDPLKAIRANARANSSSPTLGETSPTLGTWEKNNRRTFASSISAYSNRSAVSPPDEEDFNIFYAAPTETPDNSPPRDSALATAAAAAEIVNSDMSQYQKYSQTLRGSQVKSVMRLQKEAGLDEFDFDRLEESDSEDRQDKEWRMSLNSLDSEDLTPRAEAPSFAASQRKGRRPDREGGNMI